MKMSTKLKIRLLVALTVATAVVAGLFRAVLLLKYIDPVTGFYSVSTNLDIVFNVAVVVLIGVICLAGFMTRKTNPPENLDSRSTAVVFTSALCAVMYISVFLYGAYNVINGFSDNWSYLTREVVIDSFGTVQETGIQKFLKVLVNVAPDVTSNGLLFVFQLVLCIPCCLNHFSICSSEIRAKNTKHSVFAISEAVFFALRLVEVFMDTTTQINASQRSLSLLLICSAMLFFLFEAGFLVQREEGGLKSVSKYLMAGLATVAFPIVSLIPYLAVSLFWCYPTGFLVMDVLECCIMLFAASRLLTLRGE